jgi:hypothetical protein
MAVGGLRSYHQAGQRVVDRIEAAGRLTGDDRPVVLTTWVGGARLAWPTFDDHRWLYAPEDEVGRAVDALRAAGVAGPGPDRFLAPEVEAAVGAVRAGVVRAAAEAVTGPLH